MAPENVPSSPRPTPQALAESLKQNKILKELGLDGNDLGDLGAEAPLPKPPEGMGFGGRCFAGRAGWSSWGFSEDFCVLSVKYVNIRKRKVFNDHYLVTILVLKDNSFDFRIVFPFVEYRKTNHVGFCV